VSDSQRIHLWVPEVAPEQLAAAARTLSVLVSARGGTADDLREALLMIGFPESALRCGL
jgi:hypothetical protein